VKKKHLLLHQLKISKSLRKVHTLVNLMKICVKRKKQMKKRHKSKLLLSMMITQISKKRMSMDKVDFTAGFSCKKVTESFQKHSSLSQQLVDVTTSIIHLTTQLKVFSITRTFGLTWIPPENFMKSISISKMIKQVNGSM